jgi:BirA family biotin operon repressor/biotin-[acetyl-CoA-carboxylase] ligase
MTVWLRTTTSTMKDASALAARGEPHGTVVVAEEQSAGVGRQGHAWLSEHGAGLYISIILRLPLTLDGLPVLTMALGLAVQQAVNRVAGVSCDLRWPNDLLLNEKKLAGILVQTTEGGLIAGIGLNVNQTAFPDDLSAIATSLLIETRAEHSKDALLDGIVAESLEYARLLAEEGTGPILEQFGTRSSYVSGKAVDVDLGDRVISGITSGLDQKGFLLVDTGNGIETIITGGVRPQAVARKKVRA